MLTKTTKSKLERVTISIGECEIKEAIMEWLVNHGHHRKFDRDSKSSLISTTLDILEDNTAEFIMDYTTKEAP